MRPQGRWSAQSRIPARSGSSSVLHRQKRDDAPGVQREKLPAAGLIEAQPHAPEADGAVAAGAVGPLARGPAHLPVAPAAVGAHDLTEIVQDGLGVGLQALTGHDQAVSFPSSWAANRPPCGGEPSLERQLFLHGRRHGPIRGLRRGLPFVRQHPGDGVVLLALVLTDFHFRPDALADPVVRAHIELSLPGLADGLQEVDRDPGPGLVLRKKGHIVIPDLPPVIFRMVHDLEVDDHQGVAVLGSLFLVVVDLQVVIPGRQGQVAPLARLHSVCVVWESHVTAPPFGFFDTAHTTGPPHKTARSGCSRLAGARSPGCSLAPGPGLRPGCQKPGSRVWPRAFLRPRCPAGPTAPRACTRPDPGARVFPPAGGAGRAPARTFPPGHLPRGARPPPTPRTGGSRTPSAGWRSSPGGSPRSGLFSPQTHTGGTSRRRY